MVVVSDLCSLLVKTWSHKLCYWSQLGHISHVIGHILENKMHGLLPVGGLEGQSPRQHLKHQHSKGPPIRCSPVPFPAHHLNGLVITTAGDEKGSDR